MKNTFNSVKRFICQHKVAVAITGAAAAVLVVLNTLSEDKEFSEQ